MMRNGGEFALPPRRVVLLGGSGFIGSALCERLKQIEGCEVRAFSSTSLDLTAAGASARLASELDGDTVLVLTSRVPHAPAADVVLAANVAACLSSVRRCVYFSSSAVYGERTNRAVTEQTPPRPTTPYGTAKLAAERLLREAAGRAGVPLVVLRPCMVYGPGDPSIAYGPGRFLQAILRGESVRLFGDGSELRDYLFITDLVEATLALTFGGPAGIYNLATGVSHSFQALLACLRSVSGRAFDVVSVPRDRPPTDQCFLPARLLSVLPGFRFTPLEAGLAWTWARLRDRTDVDSLHRIV